MKFCENLAGPYPPTSSLEPPSSRFLPSLPCYGKLKKKSLHRSRWGTIPKVMVGDTLLQPQNLCHSMVEIYKKQRETHEQRSA